MSKKYQQYFTRPFKNSTGEAGDIITAITDLSEAVCKHYPQSDFTKRFQEKFRKGRSQSA